MTAEESLVMAAMSSWNSNLKAIDTFFAERSDSALDAEVAPGKNRLIYLLGHFASVHDRMIALLGVGERLHPHLDVLFLTSKDREHELPPASEIRRMYAEINEALTVAMMRLSPGEWLQRHMWISEEDFAREPHRNRFSVLLSRTNHVWYHYGQMVLAPRSVQS